MHNNSKPGVEGRSPQRMAAVTMKLKSKGSGFVDWVGHRKFESHN